MGVGKDQKVEPGFLVSIDILRLVKESQQQHGLRHADFQRYRGYCSRRISRLRKALKLPQGDKRHFKKRDVSSLHLIGSKIDVRCVQIPLTMAERSWAHAMQLRQESNTEPRKKFHLVNKLRKAANYSLQLQNLCQGDIFDARTKLEADAYVAWIHGILHLELSLWKNAAENLKKAQVIYEKLAQALSEEEQNLFKARVDEITPSLRYCAYNIGDGASIDDLLELRARGLLENIDILVAQTKTQSTESLQTIEWRGRKVTVRPERVRLFLLSLLEYDKSLEKAETNSKIGILENIIMDCKDAISTVKDEIKQDPKLRTGASGQPVSGIQFLLAYLSHIRLHRTLERNLCLIVLMKGNLDDPNEKSNDGKKVRPQDLTRLYEIVLHNLSEMQQINLMDSDTDYQCEIENLSLAFQAFRCYYIALTLVELRRWKEAVALYEKSKKYAQQALAKGLDIFNLHNELETLIVSIDKSKFSAHAFSVLENKHEDFTSISRIQKHSRPLYETLTHYREDQILNSRSPNAYKVVPDMILVSSKPLFFDLALNHAELPSYENKVQTPNKSGISNFVKGFLGWGGAK